MCAKKVEDNKYAAIYARISGKKDNSSIAAQIEEGKVLANKKELVVYDSYVDTVSGKSIPPEERKGYKKLFADAKSGCFKTLIIYRYDRLVRNYNDWIKTSSLLKGLGVKILLADETQPACSDDPNDRFLTNLMVLFSDFEPDNIKQRVSEGKRILREKGIYNSGKAEPFGYKKIDRKRKVGENIKFDFEAVPIKKEFIKYVYKSFYDALCAENGDNSHQIKEYKKMIKELHTKSGEMIAKLKCDIQEKVENVDYANVNFNIFVENIKSYDENEILKGLNSIEDFFFIKVKENKIIIPDLQLQWSFLCA